MQQKAGTDYSEDVETSPTSVRWVWRHRANQLSHSPEYEWKEMATSVGEGTSVSKLHDPLYSSQECLTLPSPKLTFPLLLHKRTAQALIWKSQLTSGYYLILLGHLSTFQLGKFWAYQEIMGSVFTSPLQQQGLGESAALGREVVGSRQQNKIREKRLLE